MAAILEALTPAAEAAGVNRGSHAADVDHVHLERIQVLAAFVGDADATGTLATIFTAEEARAAFPQPWSTTFPSLVYADRGAPLPELEDVSRAMAATMALPGLSPAQVLVSSLLLGWYARLAGQRLGLASPAGVPS